MTDTSGPSLPLAPREIARDQVLGLAFEFLRRRHGHAARTQDLVDFIGDDLLKKASYWERMDYPNMTMGALLKFDHRFYHVAPGVWAIKDDCPCGGLCPCHRAKAGGQLSIEELMKEGQKGGAP